MSDTESQEIVRTLDPFGFLVGQGSAIRPLGGEVRSPDPRYVFHTPYVEFRPGRVVFTIRFDRLQASFGELRVNINAHIPGSGRDAIFVTSSRLLLEDKQAMESGLAISILAVAGATYAAYGLCADGTDAQAAGLSVTAEEVRSGEVARSEQPLPPTRLGSTAMLQASARLVDDKAPSFRDPVSQPMTASQLTEPEYRRWLAGLPRDTGDDRARWQLAFIAQTLDRYGMLREGGRGITLGREGAKLASIMAAAGCEAVMASLPSTTTTLDFAWNNIICAPLYAVSIEDGAPSGVPLLISNDAAERSGFDFLWSIGFAGLGHAAGHRAAFLDELMAVLRPGGYAVHMFELAASDDSAKNALTRPAVERLAVTLISRGFSVAQLNFSGITHDSATVPFGLIVRKN